MSVERASSYAADSSIGTRIEGSSFSGLLTRVGIGNVGIVASVDPKTGKFVMEGGNQEGYRLGAEGDGFFKKVDVGRKMQMTPAGARTVVPRRR